MDRLPKDPLVVSFLNLLSEKGPFFPKGIIRFSHSKIRIQKEFKHEGLQLVIFFSFFDFFD